jgi:chromosome segregation ATPase
MVNHPNRQKALADGIKGMDGRMARQVCQTLGINFDLPNAVDVWMRDLLASDATSAKAINSNAPLMDIIKSFAVAAANPALNSKSLAFSRVKAAMTVLPIPVRTPRTYEHKSDTFTGGGRNVKLVANTYEQYTDSLKRLASMSGGGAELNKTHDEIANIYNSFVYSLQAKGKQIDNNDHLKIRHEIDKLRALEEKLSKVVIYITRYNALLNSSDPEIQRLVSNGTINVDLLENLNNKYEELKKKHEKKSYGIMSITDAINKVLSAADSVKADVASLKECLGPECEAKMKERLAASAELDGRGAFRWPVGASASSTPSGTPTSAPLGLRAAASRVAAASPFDSF